MRYFPPFLAPCVPNFDSIHDKVMTMVSKIAWDEEAWTVQNWGKKFFSFFLKIENIYIWGTSSGGRVFVLLLLLKNTFCFAICTFVRWKEREHEYRILFLKPMHFRARHSANYSREEKKNSFQLKLWRFNCLKSSKIDQKTCLF